MTRPRPAKNLCPRTSGGMGGMRLGLCAPTASRLDLFDDALHPPADGLALRAELAVAAAQDGAERLVREPEQPRRGDEAPARLIKRLLDESRLEPVDDGREVEPLAAQLQGRQPLHHHRRARAEPRDVLDRKS